MGHARLNGSKINLGGSSTFLGGDLEGWLAATLFNAVVEREVNFGVGVMSNGALLVEVSLTTSMPIR